MSRHAVYLPAHPQGPTGQLCQWIDSVSLEDIPQEIRTRAKYLILDGLACGLTGARLPWSETAANAIFEMEPVGASSVFGWKRVCPILYPPSYSWLSVEM
jgi:aconitate decarboxylase